MTSAAATPRETASGARTVDLTRAGSLAPGVLALVGAKGRMLRWLVERGYPVPDGFLVPAPMAQALPAAAARAPLDDLLGALRRLEAREGRRFGPPPRGFTVSVRPSPPVDVPGYGLRFTQVGRAGWNRPASAVGRAAGPPWTTGPLGELLGAVAAVAASGSGPALAVVVQVMVPTDGEFPTGNGTILSHDPVFGGAGLVGELRVRSPAGRTSVHDLADLARGAPAVLARLRVQLAALERDLGEAVEAEFAIAGGSTFLVQARPLRSPSVRWPTAPLGPSRHRMLATGRVVSRGLGFGSLGVMGGPRSDRRPALVVVAAELSALRAADLTGVAGVFTAQGSRFEHAASRLRQRGIPALVEVAGTAVDPSSRTVRFGSRRVELGQPVIVDAERGQVLLEGEG